MRHDLGCRVHRFRGLFAEEQPHAADGDQVAVPQATLADPVAVHHGTVGRVAVAQEELGATPLDHRVATRDHGIGKDQVVRRVAADRDDLLPRQRDLSPVRSGGVDDELRHR
jgi:hypothetical protein